MFTHFISLKQFVGDNEELEHCIQHYFNQGLEYFEILQFLPRYHHTTIGKSTLLRRLKENGLSRRTNLNITNVIQETRDRIVSIVDGSESSSGYRSIWYSLQLAGFCVPRNLVQRILKDTGPEGTESRRRNRLRRRIYRNPGPNYAWHIDRHDKLQPFGFAIHGAIDGYSRKILWLRDLRSNNSSSIIGNIYLDCVKEFQGCPTKLITDSRTGNVLTAALQTYFRQDVNAHHYVPSTRNRRIESSWSFFTKSKGRWWKHFFLDLESNGRLGMTFLIDRECLWFSFASILQSELDVMKDHWNSHRIGGSRFETVPGRPGVLYYLPDISGGAGNLKLHVTEQKLIAVSQYIATESNPTNEYQEYFEYAIRSLRLENPSNYQQGLDVFLMLKHTALTGMQQY